MKKLAFAFILAAGPALASGSGTFFSLRSTNFIVTIAFLIFIGILLWVNVPKLLGGQLDKRAEGIRSDLDEARKVHDEAKAVLAAYEKKKEEARVEVGQIVETAKREAAAAAEQAKSDLAASIERRLKGAEDQIASAEAAAVREVRDRAINVAVDAAREVLGSQMTAAERNRLVDAAISDVETKLH